MAIEQHEIKKTEEIKNKEDAIKELRSVVAELQAREKFRDKNYKPAIDLTRA